MTDAKNLTPTRFDPWTLQPVVSRYSLPITAFKKAHVHAMKKYSGSESTALPSALGESEWSTSRPDRLTSENKRRHQEVGWSPELVWTFWRITK